MPPKIRTNCRKTSAKVGRLCLLFIFAAALPLCVVQLGCEAAEVPASQPQFQAAALKQEAITVAEQVATAYPNDALTYALLGSAFYNTGRSEEATKYLRKCLEIRPGLVDAYDIMARVAYEKGEAEEAIRLCQEALNHGPGTPDILNRLGRAFIDLGKADEAIAALQQAARLPGAIAESSYLLGQAFMQKGDFEQAKKSFLQAIQLQPDHTQAYFGLYTASQRLDQPEDAIKFREQFQKLEAIDRKALTDRSAQEDTLTGLPAVRETVARTLFGAAQIYLAYKESEKAAGILRRTAVLDPDNPRYRSTLETIYVQRKAPGEGVKVFEQLVAEQPGNSLNYFFLGRLQARLDQFDAAERSFQKVQELTPGWAEGHRALAELYLRANRKIEQAGTLAKKAVDLEPSGAHYHFLAVAAVKNNDRAGAIEAMKRAVALSPDEKRYQQFLEQLQQTPKP